MLSAAVTFVLITGAGVRAQDGPQKPPGTDQAVKVEVQKVLDEVKVSLRLATGGMLGAIVTGAPYSAVAVTETVQTLADGNRIVRRSATSVARDSQGRMRREEQADDGTVTSVTILDPVAKTTYLLDPANRTAQPMPLVAGAAFKMAGGAGGFYTMQAAPVDVAEAKRKTAVETQAITVPGWAVASKMDGKQADVRRDSLGTQTFDGVAAEGTRSVETIPAGQIGNERAIDIVSEQWYSQELKATVMSRHDDPRSGETVYRLTNLQRNEPDPGLFQVPAGYTVKEGLKVVHAK